MNIEEQKKINDHIKSALAHLEACIGDLSNACSLALNNRAFTYADSLLRKASLCDGLRAEVSISVRIEERPLPSPVVATGHEPKSIKT